MTKLKAETWDKVQLILKNYYDGTMHSVFYYDGNLDEEILKNSLMYLVGSIPVLHSTYRKNPIHPVWVVNEAFGIDDFFSLVETGDTDAEIMRHVCQTMHEYDDMQIRVTLVRNGANDTLVIIINHMCFDGGDLKYFNHTLAALYTEYAQTGAFSIQIKNGTRAATQVYDGMSEEDKHTATHLMKNVSDVDNITSFPYTATDGTERNVIVKRKLTREVFLSLKAKGRAAGASVNDVLTAAYIRALYKLCDLPSAAKLSMSSMVDLRRYLPDKATKGLTNMTGFMPCAVSDIGEDMQSTLRAVIVEMDRNRADKFLGLQSIPLLNLAYRVFPACIANFAIRLGLKNPLFGMSNIGIIEDDKMVMGGIPLQDAWYTGAVKYKPYVQLALTTFRGEITFTVAIRGNDGDVAVAERMLEYIADNLNEFCAD